MPGNSPYLADGEPLEMYDMDGVPVRRRTHLSLLERLMPDGSWQSGVDPKRFFSEVKSVEAEPFAALVSEFLNQGR